ncbi:MAG: Uma2 family endonuclease [Gemmatimonadaceae bacterium]
MPMVAPLYYTADLVRALPDDGYRYELVDGELLVSPSPRAWHQELVFRLAVALWGYLQQQPVGHVVISPADISWTKHDLVQPDVFVVPLNEARTLEWAQMRHLLLVAEVLSPTTARADRFTKRRRYERAGVPLYWIVDGDEKRVEVWTPDRGEPVFEDMRIVWHPAGASAAQTVELSELFRPI